MNTDEIRDRIEGEKGSDQNKLRFELYTDAIERHSQAMKSGFYLEAISLCESMIADRTEALSQTILHESSSIVHTQSLGRAIRDLDEQMPQPKPEGYDSISERIKKWMEDRNEIIHGFVKVTHGNLDRKVDDRKNKAEITAEDGLELFRE